MSPTIHISSSALYTNDCILQCISVATITGESENFIEFHFKNVGDWTGNVHYLMGSVYDEREPTGVRPNKKPPVVRVEGPIGASSQGFSDRSVVVLVGAGIGIT